MCVTGSISVWYTATFNCLTFGSIACCSNTEKVRNIYNTNLCWFTWQQAAWCWGEVPPTPTLPALPLPSWRNRARSTLARVGESRREGDALPGVEHPASTTSILYGTQLIHIQSYICGRPRETATLVAASWLAEPHSGQLPHSTSLRHCLISWTVRLPSIL